MAKAAETSDRMLLYHFKSKAGVMEAALEEIARRNSQALDQALPPEPLRAMQLMPMIGAVMQSGAFGPSIAVFLELASLSLRGDDMARRVGYVIAVHFQQWLAARLTEPDRATELLAAIEGWGVLTAVGLDAPFPTG